MFQIGIANGHIDLLEKIKTFVSATLPVAQRHVILKDVVNGASVGDNIPIKEYMFKAPGLTGTDEIFYGFSNYQSVASDYYNAWINGYTGYIPGEVLKNQPGGIYGINAAGLGIALWNQQIPYWLVADGSGFICAVKIQNFYFTFGAGLFYKFGTFNQYPYPLLVHAPMPSAGSGRYSAGHINGWKGNRANLRMRFIDGSWLTPNVINYLNNGNYTINSNYIIDFTNKGFIRNTNSNENTASGYYSLQNLELFISNDSSTGNFYGAIPFIYHVSGYNNAVENTLVLDGITYVVLRDGNASGINDFVALKLS